MAFSWKYLSLLPCEHGTHHTDIGACRKGLGHIAGELDAAVRDDRDTVILSNGIRVHDRCDLRHTYSGDDTGRADGSGTDTYLYSIRAGLDEIKGAFGCCDVAADDRKIRKERSRNGRVRNPVR